MQLIDLSARAQVIRQLYDEQARGDGRRPWTAAEFAQGFAGDVGDLMKLVMAKQGLRRRSSAQPDLDAALAHELADCLWSVLILAETCGVDLESAFTRTMDNLEHKLRTG